MAHVENRKIFQDAPKILISEDRTFFLENVLRDTLVKIR